jgi:hypothetical protein
LGTRAALGTRKTLGTRKAGCQQTAAAVTPSIAHSTMALAVAEPR